MDRIHPIVPVAVQPAPVGSVRRVARAGDEPEREPEPRERRRREGRAEPPAADGVVRDGHLDARI